MEHKFLQEGDVRHRSLCRLLIIQDDGNLVAYRGVLSVTTAFWSSWHSSKDVFDRVASKELSPMCPIFEDPKSISSNLLSTKPFHSGSPLVSISHDELLKHHRPWKQSDNNNNKDTSGAMSIFDLYALWRPEWVADYKAMMLSPDGASIQQYVTQYNQTIYYGQRNVSGRYVTQYVATTVKRQHLNTGQDTNDAARKYINELVEASGVDATSHQDMYQSLNAGHVLLKVMGGPIKNWNLFPQYGTMNRDKWNALEKGIAEKIRDEGFFVVAEYYLQYGTTYETIPKYVHYSYRFFDKEFGYVSSIRGVYENILPNDDQVAYWAIYNNGSIPVVFVQDKNDGWTQGKLLDELNRQFANHMACLKNKFPIYDYYDYDS